MAAIARENDSIDTAHGCDATSTLKSGSQRGNSKNVFANGLGISCIGDPVTEHTYLVGDSCVDCPEPVTLAGSGKVFVGGVGVCRVNDAVDATVSDGVITSGSDNVYAGD